MSFLFLQAILYALTLFAMFQIPRALASQEEEEEEEEEDRNDSGLTAPDEAPTCSVSNTGSTTSLKRKKRTQKLDEALKVSQPPPAV